METCCYNKPSVFFSYSSKDKDIIENIKKKLTKYLSKCVDIYIYSDEDAKKKGINWQLELLDSLKKSQILFIFISPSSIKSPWVYFEAGFIKALERRIIPVCILGANKSDLPPPLEHITSFNITSYDSLNTIISIINDEFGYAHEHKFSSEDFKEIFSKGVRSGLSEYLKYFDKMFYYPPIIDQDNRQEEFAIVKFKNYLTDEGIPFHYDDKDVHNPILFGRGIKYIKKKIKIKDKDESKLIQYRDNVIEIDREFCELTVPFLDKFFTKKSIPVDSNYHIFSISLNKNIIFSGFTKINIKLTGSNINLLTASNMTELGGEYNKLNELQNFMSFQRDDIRALEWNEDYFYFMFKNLEAMLSCDRNNQQTFIDLKSTEKSKHYIIDNNEWIAFVDELFNCNVLELVSNKYTSAIK